MQSEQDNEQVMDLGKVGINYTCVANWKKEGTKYDRTSIKRIAKIFFI